MPPSISRLPSFQGARAPSIRSYFRRIPLFTIAILIAILVFWILSQTSWNVVYWGGLVPKEVNLGTMYRLNTYPLIHVNLLQTVIDTCTLLPLLERFESEHGTLLTGALFLGPLSTLPGGLYILIDYYILRRDSATQGASLWVFLLLGHEAIKAWRNNPSFNINTVSIPTYTLPLFALVVSAVMLPNVGFLSHLCALGVGYVYGLGYLKFMAPPEGVLRWIEGKGNLLGRLPHYVSVDQKTFGRYGVLPTTSNAV